MQKNEFHNVGSEEAARAGDLAQTEQPLASTADEVRRIDFTGTIWFAAAILAAGVSLGGLLANGWRPYELPPAAAVAWWLGFVLVLLSIAAFGWAGCPVLGTDVASADKQKSLCIRLGVVILLAGTAITSLAVLLTSPS